jgi:hypothetical protein
LEFDPIILRYDGLSANRQLVELAQIGQSLQGAAQLLGSAASIVETGEYSKQLAAMPVRIYAGVPAQGSWEIPAIIKAIVPAISELPVIADLRKVAATRAATAIVNGVIKMFKRGSSDKGEVKMIAELAEKALAEAGQNHRYALDAMLKMVEMQRPAARLLVAPVGFSCETMQIGDAVNGAAPIDIDVRAAIEAHEVIDIQPAARHEILISEMDRVNATCKFAFRGEEGGDRRITGEITDPIIQTPNDPYSAAFSAKRWIKVTGKLQLKKGEPNRLFISDIETHEGPEQKL